MTTDEANEILRGPIDHASLHATGTNVHYVAGHTTKSDNPVWYRRGVQAAPGGKIKSIGPGFRAFLKELDREIAANDELRDALAVSAGWSNDRIEDGMAEAREIDADLREERAA